MYNYFKLTISLLICLTGLNKFYNAEHPDMNDCQGIAFRHLISLNFQHKLLNVVNN